MKITRKEGERILGRDIAIFASGVQSLLARPLSESQFSALVSFAYNVGLENFRKSSVLRAVNAGDFAAVKQNAPAGVAQQASDDAQQRGLARVRVARDEHEGPRGGRHRNGLGRGRRVPAIRVYRGRDCEGEVSFEKLTRGTGLPFDFAVCVARAELEQRLRTLVSAHWIDVLNKAGVPTGPIYAIDEAFAEYSAALFMKAAGRLTGQAVLGDLAEAAGTASGSWTAGDNERECGDAWIHDDRSLLTSDFAITA